MLPVSLLDLILRGFGFDAESIVELCFCYHRRRGPSKVPGASNSRKMGNKVNWQKVLNNIGLELNGQVKIWSQPAVEG